MKLPVVAGWIERRVLLNYRVDAEVLAAMLPAPFRPKLVRGSGVAGICLIRLRQVRPRPLPALVGLASENAAHRIAVEWDGPDGVCEGVYVARRDTSSPFNVLTGGRLFPGLQRRARFQVREWPEGLSLSVNSRDGRTRIAVRGSLGQSLPPTSLFASLGEASEFFRHGSLGYSSTSRPGSFDGMELRATGWRVEPLNVDVVESSYFDDRSRFPAESIAFDSALLMRSIPHEWRARERLTARQAVPQLSHTYSVRQ
jgi:hypothetical protein